MVFDPYSLRQDFPVLNRTINGKQLIYFDNAATSQKPVQVIEAVVRFYKMFNANVHRGLHTLSQEASQMYEEAHQTIAKFIKAKGVHEIVFVKNSTEALNTIAFSWGMKNLREGDEIITSIMEHHSNFLPWFKIAELKKARVKVVDVDEEGRLRYDQLEEMISERTKVIAITCMSNVTGVIVDIKRISKIAHEVGAIVVADGAQYVPHVPTNVKELNVDFLVFSGHKMLGPTGVGVLYMKESIAEEMDTFLVGGDTIKEVHYDGRLRVVWHDLPWRFEAGTPNIAGAIGLAEAAKYLMKIGMENVRRHEEELLKYFFKRVEEERLGDAIKILGPKSYRGKGGIIAFTIKNLDPHATAVVFDEEGIAVRSGFHCAQPLHERLGFKRGSVRASFYLYNIVEEIDRFIDVIKSILKAGG